jgi:hypothetical protein
MRPMRSVITAPHRNHHSARGSSCGFTTFFVSLSSFPWSGTLTKLKKYRCPIHVMPARMCSQRTVTWAIELVSGRASATAKKLGDMQSLLHRPIAG